MSKLLFLPVSTAAGLLAGLISKKVFQLAWGAVDQHEPPQAEHRRIHLGKLALALSIEGAVFRLVQGLADHGSRRAFRRLTGAWPGDEAPQPSER